MNFLVQMIRLNLTLNFFMENSIFASYFLFSNSVLLHWASFISRLVEERIWNFRMMGIFWLCLLIFKHHMRHILTECERIWLRLNSSRPYSLTSLVWARAWSSSRRSTRTWTRSRLPYTAYKTSTRRLHIWRIRWASWDARPTNTNKYIVKTNKQTDK